MVLLGPLSVKKTLTLRSMDNRKIDIIFQWQLTSLQAHVLLPVFY